MKLELGLSVLSKRESLLGIDIQTHNGMAREDNILYREKLVELRIGIIFAYISICFITKGEELEIPENIKETFDNIEKQIKEHIDK